MKDEIVLYRPDEQEEHIEVKLQDETVWLNRQQLSTLFERDIKTIGKHITNVLREELAGLPVVAKFATTASDGKLYQIDYYNLEMNWSQIVTGSNRLNMLQITHLHSQSKAW